MMDDANRMLSQEEIDTLLTSHFANSKENTPKVNVKSTTSVITPEKPVNLVPQTLKPSEIMPSDENDSPQYQPLTSLEETIADLSKRIKKIEMVVETLEKQNGNGRESTDENSNQIDEHLSSLDEQLRTITEKLKGTAGYNINKTYTCRQCGAVGIVGIRVRCNECGQEGWWGWWPKKNK
jgi:TolA-binding protein